LSARCLVDTNILVYAANRREGPTARVAAAVLERITAEHWGVTHPQVVAEFIAAVTRPRVPAPILSTNDAVLWIADWLASTEWRDLTREVSLTALRAISQYQMAIYDAQMWAVARVNAIPILVTQDTQFQPVIEGVRYVNPFDASFVLADLGL
jgi:predicted nucleic acid-binding protein